MLSQKRRQVIVEISNVRFFFCSWLCQVAHWTLCSFPFPISHDSSCWGTNEWGTLRYKYWSFKTTFFPLYRLKICEKTETNEHTIELFIIFLFILFFFLFFFFLPILKMKVFTLLLVISKRFELQRPDWTHLEDFLM